MSKTQKKAKATRGLAAIRNLFSKAADMGGDEYYEDESMGKPGEDGTENLDADLSPLEHAKKTQAKGTRKHVIAKMGMSGDEDEYDDEDDEDDEGMMHGKEGMMHGKEGEEYSEDDMPVMGKAEASTQDATPILEEIADELATLRRQNALLAKGLAGMAEYQEVLTKGLTDLQGEVESRPVLPRSGRQRRRQPTQPEASQPPVSIPEVLAKAVTDTEHFTAREVSKLESLMQAGKYAEVSKAFRPEQLLAIGFPVKN